MSTQSMPPIPPRPTRSHEKASGASLGGDLPKIPPRPINRRIARSPSPGRGSFAPSPLNIPLNGQGKAPGQRSTSEGSSIDPPPRPPSVNLPSIGQEGAEYGEVFSDSSELGSSPEHTRNIANDLKLYAPKPSLPTSSAKKRVSVVTRTDSGQVAALGLGKTPNYDDSPKPSSSSQHSASGDRPLSLAEAEEQGIPTIGLQVPMYPNAGDVQAPSPAPTQTQFAPGIGFHNDGSRPRTHGRKNSSRGFEGPPGSYGLHGHGTVPSHHLEKAYYEKHPELAIKEAGHYPAALGVSREFAMSSEDLNKIVRESKSRGMGASRYMGTPDENIGYQATEEYASRMSSPQPQSYHAKAHSSSSQTHIESPLKKSSYPTEPVDSEVNLNRSNPDQSDVAIESDVEDDDNDEVIHVEKPSRSHSRIAFAESTEDLERSFSQNEHDDFAEEYSAPILAEDEVEKEPFGYSLEPAVSPVLDRDHYRTMSGGSQSNSRPVSRPASIHGGVSGFVNVSTPLEDLHEYEPLFPDDHKGHSSPHKPLTAADRLKRPEHRKFPSRDIWEDTPNSLQYTATVSTPQLPDEDSPIDERPTDSPAHQFARKQEQLAESEAKTPENLQSVDAKSWVTKSPALSQEARSSSTPKRFPSKDIWEDTPDSHQLQATVSTDQLDDGTGEAEPTSATATKAPEIPARPTKAKPDVSPERPRPAVPERPAQKPSLPERAKPQIPARPARTTAKDAPAEGAEPSTSAATKPKPPVPSRPLGSKIAALQGGFLSDLNKRLQLGPQAPKKEESPPEAIEEPKEKAPLSDARKGRARGPARRAPAKSPAPTAAIATGAEKNAVVSFAYSSPLTIWHISPDSGDLELTYSDTGSSSQEAVDTSDKKEVDESNKKENNSSSTADASKSSTEAASSSKEQPGTSFSTQEKSSTTTSGQANTSVSVPSDEESAAEANVAAAAPTIATNAEESTSKGTAAAVDPEPNADTKAAEDVTRSAEIAKPDREEKPKSIESEPVDAAEPGFELKQALEEVAEDEQS